MITLCIILWIICGAIAAPIVARLYEKKHKKHGDEQAIAFIFGPISLIMVLTALIMEKYYKK